MFEDLKNKRVVVTGASGGIGAGIAKEFGRCGAGVLVQYRTHQEGAEATASEINKLGGDALHYRADLRSEKGVEDLFGYIGKVWDGLDVLVNNAGIVLKASVLNSGAEYWDEVLNVNLRAPYLLSRLAAERMIKSGKGGCILNNTSVHGYLSVQYFSAYAASKAALNSLTRVQALEWAPGMGYA